MLAAAKHINFNKNKNVIDKMETQEIPKAQEPQKTYEPKTEDPKKTEEPKKKREKNPIRVAAGKKGAEARLDKQKQAQQAQAEHEPIRTTKEPPPHERPQTVNVYKNFCPLCVLIGAAGVGIFMIYGRKTEMQPKIQPETQPERKQRPIDPIEMR